ncbi:DUF7146 domain-containing protein [Marinovum algicola]|uniref:DUF7146 domain-containing protein n=1 Tax=Marinovum algicola TaxID=42444 RepID=UPI003B517A14
MLLAQLGAVVDRYAPPANGSHQAFGKYFTLNPGRADRSVGSFYVYMSGPKAGRWCDHACPSQRGLGYGDILDLIALSCRTDMRGALSEARAFLGLQTLSAEDMAARRRAAEQAKQERAAQARQDALRIQKRAGQAQALWLSGRVDLRGSPVDLYLRGRGIDLGRLGRAPGVIRYVPKCRYYFECDKTGEITEGEYPAMVAAVTDSRGKFVACHRHYLALGQDGWGKAPVPQAKLAFGNYGGAAINVWRGVGPRGGKPASLPQCPPGTHVYVAEGLEDALSVVLLLPEARVLAAISLSNFATLRLPRNVSTLTLVADLDENATAAAQLRHAIASHQAAGRDVRLWQNAWGGKDVNDALRAAQEGVA